MPEVRVPTVLRPHVGGRDRVEVEGSTVVEVLAALVADNPALEDRLLEGGKVRGYVNVYVDDEDVRYLDGEATAVSPDAVVSILPAVAGGSCPKLLQVRPGSAALYLAASSARRACVQLGSHPS